MSGSIMPGSNEGYTKIAAVAKGEPCRRHMGPDSAAHYLRMVHNGIE
jgi:6-phosphogluconate dehydrogenase